MLIIIDLVCVHIIQACNYSYPSSCALHTILCIFQLEKLCHTNNTITFLMQNYKTRDFI